MRRQRRESPPKADSSQVGRADGEHDPGTADAVENTRQAELTTKHASDCCYPQAYPGKGAENRQISGLIHRPTTIAARRYRI